MALWSSFLALRRPFRSSNFASIVKPPRSHPNVSFIQLFVVQRECEDLRNQLETSRCQLQSKSLEVADLSFKVEDMDIDVVNCEDEGILKERSDIMEWNGMNIESA